MPERDLLTPRSAPRADWSGPPSSGCLLPERKVLTVPLSTRWPHVRTFGSAEELSRGCSGQTGPPKPTARAANASSSSARSASSSAHEDDAAPSAAGGRAAKSPHSLDRQPQAPKSSKTSPGTAPLKKAATKKVAATSSSDFSLSGQARLFSSAFSE